MLIKVGSALINTNNIAWVQDYGGYCTVYFTVVTQSGSSLAGGQGSIIANPCNMQLRMSIDDLLALINKEVALVHAMEEAAGVDSSR